LKKFIYILIFILCFLNGQSQKSTMVKSFLLPGWGQLNEANYSSAKQFFVQDGILWLSFLGSVWTSNFYKESYITFARENAGIDLYNMDLQMAVDVGNYSNLEEFNENKQRRREFNFVLDENDERNYWQWDSELNREKFEQMRINSGLSQKAGRFIIGGLIANRIISAIHVKYIQNKKIPKVGYSFSPDGSKSVKLIWNL